MKEFFEKLTNRQISLIIKLIIIAFLLIFGDKFKKDEDEELSNAQARKAESRIEYVAEEDVEEKDSKNYNIDYETEEWKILYIDYFNNNKNELNLYQFYCLEDFNGDDIPEIVLSTSSGSSRSNSLCIFLYINKNKNVIKSDIGNIRYGNDYVYITDKLLGYIFSNDSEGTDKICIYDRDKGDYLPVFKGINKTENGENKYYMESPDYPDGTECSESEYNSVLKLYTDNCTNGAYCEKSTENLLKDIEEY